MRRYAVRGALVALVAVLCAARELRAQGYGVYEHDGCATARSGAVVASPCSGGSAVYFNPAGILGSRQRTNVQVGTTVITLNGSFADSVTGITTDAENAPIPIPTLFVTRQINDRVAIGFGVFAPYGLIYEWPEDFVGRFLAYRSELSAVYFQPTVAIRPFRSINLRVGGGVTYVYSRAKLNQRVDLSTQFAAPGVTFGSLGVPAGTDFADAELSGHSLSASGHFGLIWDIHPRVSIGARYMMRQTADIAGDGSFRQIGTGIVLPPGNPLGAPGGTPLDSVLAPQFRTGSLAPQRGYVNVPLPDQLVLGIAVRPTPQLLIEFDWQWTNWELFDTLAISFAKIGIRRNVEEYRSTNGYRIGAEFAPNERLALRAGFLVHEAAAPDYTVTPLLPEGERAEVTAGVGLQLTPRMRLDVAYQYIRQQDRRGRVTEGGLEANRGLYTGGANLFGASLAFGF